MKSRIVLALAVCLLGAAPLVAQSAGADEAAIRASRGGIYFASLQ